jgi:hypothetical protein
MFTMMADSATYGISLFQNAKKEWVKNFVKDEKIATTLNEFVDTQTDFAKQVVKTSSDIGTAISKELGKFPKFDYAK